MYLVLFDFSGTKTGGTSMKKILLAAVSLFMLAMFGCAGDTNNTSVTNPNPNPFTPKGTVTGQLMDTVTAQPIANAIVAISSQTAVTDSRGLFTLTNVPASSIAIGSAGTPNNAYEVVIDMTNVNAGIDAFNAVPTNTVKKAKYPAFAYNTVAVTYTSLGDVAANSTSATNHNTPVDGFTANFNTLVGKLDANLVIQVVDTNRAIQAGMPVTLYSTGANGGGNLSTGVGNPTNVVATGTTDASGKVTFSNVEAGRRFTATADSLSLTGTRSVTAPSDNETRSYLNNQSKYSADDALVVDVADNVAPFSISSSPANLADVTADATGNVVVTFNFSEPIAQDAYATALSAATSANGGLFKDVVVNYNGPKGGNTAYTLSWSADFKALKVTFATQVSSRYSVSIAGAIGKLTDAAGNGLVAGVTDTVAFTTNGAGSIPAAPVLKANGTQKLTWTPVVNAWTYNVYVTTILGSGTITTTAVTNVGGSVASYDGTALDYTVGKTYSVAVAAVSASGIESAKSAALVLTQPTSVLAAPVLTVDPTLPLTVAGNKISFPHINAGVLNYVATINTIDKATNTILGTATQTIAPAAGVNGTESFVPAIGGFANGSITYTITVKAISTGVADVNGVVWTNSPASNVIAVADYTPAAPAVTQNGSVFTIKTAILDAVAIPNVSTTSTFNARIQAFDATNTLVDRTTTPVAVASPFDLQTSAIFLAHATQNLTYKVTFSAFTPNGTESVQTAAFTYATAQPGAVVAATFIRIGNNLSNILQWQDVPTASYYLVDILAIDATTGVITPTAAINPATGTTHYIAATGVVTMPVNGPFINGLGHAVSYKVRITAVNANGLKGPATTGTDLSLIINEQAAQVLNLVTGWTPFGVSAPSNPAYNQNFWNLFNFTTATAVATVTDSSNFLGRAAGDLTVAQGPLPALAIGSTNYYGLEIFINAGIPVTKAQVENLANWAITQDPSFNAGNPAANIVHPRVYMVAYDETAHIANVWLIVNLAAAPTLNFGDPSHEIIGFSALDPSGLGPRGNRVELSNGAGPLVP
jgi:hypothetical protein